MSSENNLISRLEGDNQRVVHDVVCAPVELILQVGHAQRDTEEIERVARPCEIPSEVRQNLQ